MLRFRHRMTPRKIKIYPGGGPEARLKKLRQIVSGLIRYERIEPTYSQGDEARQYAERLIHMAIKNGDKHAPTMEMLDYWLLEKDLIHKLFKVLVPRFQNTSSSYTSLYKLPVDYPGRGIVKGVLELKGNPWPPVMPAARNTKFILSNILLSAARKDFYAQRQDVDKEASQRLGANLDSAVLSSSTSESSPVDPSEQFSSGDNSSSVDPPRLGS